MRLHVLAPRSTSESQIAKSKVPGSVSSAPRVCLTASRLGGSGHVADWHGGGAELPGGDAARGAARRRAGVGRGHARRLAAPAAGGGQSRTGGTPRRV